MSHLLNIIELQDLNHSLADFEQQITKLAQDLNINLTKIHCDHISVRCNQVNDAERWRNGFTQCGTLLAENIIKGRPVCLFDLIKPIEVAGLKIDCVELPYPGDKMYKKTGWEHIELVLPCEPEMLGKNVFALVSDEGLLMKGITVHHSTPQAEGERLINTTIAFSNGQVAIKFHPYSIRKVIKSN